MDKRSNNSSKKIILGMLKGKSVTTSTPSMAIRFNATAEEIEEIYTNEEEQSDRVSDSILLPEKSNDSETSPRRSILPLLGKRSTSIDTNSANTQDSSPPSDPWRFLSDIKGKITKSVEVKFTEYKSRNQEGDGSPKITKSTKDSKENSSLSDSEEASESSISRTCGIVSTTEGVEMSSDDETPSLSDEDKKNESLLPQHAGTSIRQRYKVTNQKKKVTKEGSVGLDFLDNIQKITDGVTSVDNTEIESGVDVLADLNISNFEVDNKNVLNIHQVSGSEIRSAEFSGAEEEEVITVFSPTGFVDLRREDVRPIDWWQLIYNFRSLFFTVLCLLVYFIFPVSLYVSGFITGGLVVSVVWSLYVKFYMDKIPLKPMQNVQCVPILEMPPIKEYQPFTKYEGWVNEYPEEYNPLTYHVSQTQSVYFRLQGNFLRVSHTRQKIPKRAMWNEPEHKLVFTRHRIYNLIGAKVLLLPEGLAKIRHWSKKYPICIVLDKDQVKYEEPLKKEHKNKEIKVTEKKCEAVSETQVFSKLVDKLVENAEEQKESNGLNLSTSTPLEESASMESLIEREISNETINDLKPDAEDDEEDSFTNFQDWWQPVVVTREQKGSEETRIYIFGRTGREKEDWFRRLRFAANKEVETERATLHDQYLAYMKSQNLQFSASESNLKPPVVDNQENAWVNALIARVLFDCMREKLTIQRIKERIQRKLASVRLPYFIEELTCEELNLGTTSPNIIGSAKPVMDDRGLWIDLDISYEGLATVILRTKVNLLKLKQPHDTDKLDDKPAIFNSDVDDSAESTTDEEPIKPDTVLDARGYPVPGLGGTSNRSKKIMKMVDRIAESKFFQAATENKYIKKAMQEFSNTDLRLKVELKKCAGKLVLNIPPPPSDRVWLGFRVPPELLISAYPIVGDRNISFMRVTSWIEKKIYKEFQKIFVIPNMEDLLIPVMCPKLPE